MCRTVVIFAINIILIILYASNISKTLVEIPTFIKGEVVIEIIQSILMYP